MSDQTAPTYLEPIRDELDRLRTLLDDRSAALNRTGASNDTMRATLTRVQKLAEKWRKGYGYEDDATLATQVCGDQIRAALAVPTDQEPA